MAASKLSYSSYNRQFGSPSVFGQNSNGSSNPVTPKRFGSSTPFGSSTGGSVLGGTSTDVFGANSLSLGQHQQSTFGSPSAPAFGISTAAFVRAQSSNAPFGASSGFGQNSSASSIPFTSKSFGSTTAFGSPTGGSVFAGTSTSVFGVNSSAPAFGTASSSFGGPSILGEKSGFGGFAPRPNQSNSCGSLFQQTQTTFGSSPFGSSPSFGASTQNAFGSSSASKFGSTSAPSFALGTGGAFGAAKPLGAPSTSVLGVSTTSAFGAVRSPAFGTFGAVKSPAFDALSTTRFGCGTSNPTFGKSNSATASNPAPSVFRTRGSSGALSTTATFGPTNVGQFPIVGQQSGSRLGAYTATAEVDGGSSKQPAAKVHSISAMHINKGKNHEELRWEDYQSGDKGGIGTGGSTIQSNSFAPSPAVVQSPVNHFNSSPPSNLSAPQTSFTPNSPPLSSTFNSSLFNTSSSASSLMTTSSSAPYQFITPPIPASSCNSTSAPGYDSGLNSVNTQVSPIFQSVSPLPQTSSLPSIVPSVSQPNILCASSQLPTSDLAGLSQTTPTQTAQTGAFADSKFHQSSAGLIGCAGTTGFLGQGTFSLLSTIQNTVVAQPVPNVNPLGALPSMPQLSVGHLGPTPSIRYGISSMPVLDKPAAPVRMSSFLTSRNLSHRLIRLPARKYDPKSDGPKVPFFNNDEGMPTAPNGGAVFVPRENPRALVVRPTEQCRQSSNLEKRSQLVHASIYVYKNGAISAEVAVPALVNEDDHLLENSKLSSHEHKEHTTDVEASMPRLCHSDYYTEPQIPELAAKERAEPGFCHHVKNFVVGRHGYGSIKFLGETDVRHLHLDSHVKFNNREVMVYMDETEKLPVGEGLNKAAEVTLLNVKCIDKMGNQYITGPKVNKYREMLIKKAKEQGAEFVSYDPVEGEWKFRVQHFSRYAF